MHEWFYTELKQHLLKSDLITGRLECALRPRGSLSIFRNRPYGFGDQVFQCLFRLVEDRGIFCHQYILSVLQEISSYIKFAEQSIKLIIFWSIMYGRILNSILRILILNNRAYRWAKIGNLYGMQTTLWLEFGSKWNWKCVKHGLPFWLSQVKRSTGRWHISSWGFEHLEGFNNFQKCQFQLKSWLLKSTKSDIRLRRRQTGSRTICQQLQRELEYI